MKTLGQSKPKTKAADKTVKAGDFTFDTGLEVPATQRNASELAQKLKAMPEGASFLIPVVVPATVKGDDERKTVFDEMSRTVGNRVSGAIRRFKTKNPTGYTFVYRKVNDVDLGSGVRVWRESVSK